MKTTSYDVIVIGGGPAGVTAATLVAQQGFSVLLLERDVYPRFKIGESLIPATGDILRRLGLLEKLQASHFPKKYSVQFFTGDGRGSVPFYFGETSPEHAQTWQVLRSEFDLLLIEHAAEQGVEVHQGVRVEQVLFEGERATGVRAILADGATIDLASRIVIDASGQKALISRQLKLRATDPNLRQAAIFTHFEDAHRDAGIDEGATLILQTAEKDSWFWYIPLPENRVSVGVVGQIEYLIKGRNGDPQRVFDQEKAICPGLIPRLENARQVMDVQVLNEFSYLNTQPAGDGWVLAGDAFGFLDPMYSTGVLLAFRSAEFVADTVVEALREDDLSARRLGQPAAKILAGMKAFRTLVYAFYNKEFSFAKFLKSYPEHRLAVIAILIGDVFERDFEPLFQDLRTMIELPDQMAVAA